MKTSKINEWDSRLVIDNILSGIYEIEVKIIEINENKDGFIMGFIETSNEIT